MVKNSNFICGKHAVLSALENPARKKYQLFYLKQHQPLIDSLSNIINFKVSMVTAPKLNELTNNYKHQGFVLFCETYVSGGIENYLDKLKKDTANNKSEKIADDTLESTKKKERIVIIDHPQDSRNVGSVIRSMYLNKFGSLFLPKIASCNQDPAMANAAAGALDAIDYYLVHNINQLIKVLKQNDFWIVGLSQNGTDISKLNEQINSFDKMALIVGQEGAGLTRLVEKNCDYLVSLKMINNLVNNTKKFLPDSYNMSTAVSIAMYEINQYS